VGGGQGCGFVAAKLRGMAEFLRVHRTGGGGGPALDVAADAVERMQPEGEG
jgi:hypothetical protein